MKNTIVFERGKSPKSGIGIGIDGMIRKHKILLIESPFADIGSGFSTIDKIINNSGLPVRATYDANFIIVHNNEEFIIVKKRFAPAQSEMSPTIVAEFVMNWKYPKKDMNRCIMWIAKISEKISEEWDKTLDDYD